MIIAENLGMSYRDGPSIFRNVSFRLKPGSFHFLAGASGSGKTTLLKILSLTLRPTEGTLSLNGDDLTAAAREELPALRQRIGFVAQDFRLLDHLTVEENVGLPLKIAGEEKQAIHEKVTEMLEWVGLKEFQHSLPEVLSGGQKQRVAIARAVITKPDLLLADEPTGNLDTQLSLRFVYLFEALNQMGTTVVLATHDEHMISLFNYPVLRLENGTVRLTQPNPNDLPKSKLAL